MALSAETLKNLLLKEQILTEGQFKEVELESKRSGVPIARILISEGRLTQQYLNQLVSKFLNIPLFDPRVTPPEPAAVELLPEDVSRQRQVLVFAGDKNKKTFRVAMVDPTDVENMNFLREYLGGTIEFYIATPEDVRSGYQIYKRRASEDFEKIIEGKIRELSRSLKQGESNILENIPLVELFDTLLDYGAILETSDIYFQPQEDFLKIRFRIDGLLREILAVDKSVNEGIIARIKSLAGLRIDEHMKPQDGRFRFRSGDVDIDVRCAVMPTIFGEKATLRLLTGAQSFLTFEELGMNRETIEKLLSAIKKPFGMILSSGPTGSGKTTTIYALLKHLNRPEVHIATIEDPIEYIVPNISQTQVNIQANITFASGLRALLRHSPDTIFIGEIRDGETADVCINAALTGHLLISTIHTNNAPSAIIRLLDMGVPPFLIAATLNTVIAQRLVRKICINCIESVSPQPAILDRLAKEFAKIKRKPRVPKILFRGKGCAFCGHTGFKGRAGIFEIFLVDNTVKQLISSKDVTLEQLQKVASEQGMQSMLEDGLWKIEVGLTTAEELLRVISEE